MTERAGKRLVVCCDGTWCDPSNDTNVARTAFQAVLATRHFGVETATSARGWSGTVEPPKREQLVYYDTGVGTKEGRGWWQTLSSAEGLKDLVTENDYVRVFLGGATGFGLSENIQQAYRFLAEHYRDGDEIFLIGFSRGAYTVRSLGGLLSAAGLLWPQHVDVGKDPSKDPLVAEAYAYYRAAPGKDGRPSERDRHSFAAKRASVARPIGVTFVGVYDTVGSVGIPLTFAQQVGLNRKHGFHDTELGRNVRVARHAMGIDERRGPFKATYWTGNGRTGEANVKQVWFAGVHGDVGGGVENRGLSNLALGWLMREAEAAGLEIDPRPLQEWQGDPVGPVHDNMRGIWWALHGLGVLKRYVRPIGPERRAKVEGPDCAQPVREMLHGSVWRRLREHDGAPDYRPPNLALGGQGPIRANLRDLLVEDDERRSPRVACREGGCRVGNRNGFTIVDRSAGGIRLAPAVDLPDGTPVEVEAPTLGRRSGEVRWSGPTASGIAVVA